MENLVTIITFMDVNQLGIPKSLLESEGIPCFVTNELTAQIYPIEAMGGVKLQVEERDVEQAVSVLVKGGFLKEEDLKPSGIYEAIGKFLSKFGKK